MSSNIAHEARRVRRRGRDALQLVEPAVLLGGAVGDELRGEELAERRVLLAPAELGQLASSSRPPRAAPASRVAHQPSARVAAVQDQVAHPLGVAHRVGDRDRRALRDAEQREALERRPRRPRSRGRAPSLERELGDLPVREPAAALVVAHEACGRATARAASGARPGCPSRTRGATASSTTLTSGGPSPVVA